MQVITTHTNSDFDALASLVAASFLYPQAKRVIPSQVNPMVREFLAVHWDMLRLVSRKSLDLSNLTSLIVTDTSSWKRLDNMHELQARHDLEVILWDHHMGQAGIRAGIKRKEEVGATVCCQPS